MPTSDRYAVFLRGINVGKAKRVAMADLRALVESLGYRDVATLLNSGNVVLTAPAGRADAIAKRIESAMPKQLGVSARVMALSSGAVDTAMRENPFASVANDPKRYLVGMLGADARMRLAPLQARDWAPDALAVGSEVAYLWCPGGILASPLLTAVGRALGDDVTTRNWATMEKLHALVA